MSDGQDRESSERLARLEELINRFDRCLNDTEKVVDLIADSCYNAFVRSVEENWDKYFKQNLIPFKASHAAQFIRSKVGKNLAGAVNLAGKATTAEALARDEKFQACVKPLTDAVEEYLQLESQKLAEKLDERLRECADSANETMDQILRKLEQLQAEGVDLEDILSSMKTPSVVLLNIADAATLSGWSVSMTNVVREITAGAVAHGYLMRLVELCLSLRLPITAFLETPYNLGNRILLEGHKVRDAVVGDLRNNRELFLSELHDRTISVIREVRARTTDALGARLERELSRLDRT